MDSQQCIGIEAEILVGIGETVKWGGAVLGAPDTGGVSLGLLAVP